MRKVVSQLKKVTKIINSSITILLTIILIFMVFMVASTKFAGGEPEIFGYQLKTVLSGSMEPGILTGSIIAIKPIEEDKTFKKGDIITFVDSEERLVTHRVIDVKGVEDSHQYITKGDNNDSADTEPVLTQNIRGEYHGFTVPYLGYALEFAKTKLGSALLLIIPGVFFLIYSFVSIWKTIVELERKKGVDVSSTNN